MNSQIQHQPDLFSARSYLTAYDIRSSLPTSPQPPRRLSSRQGAPARKSEHTNSPNQPSSALMNTRRVPSTRSTGRPRLGADDRAVLSEDRRKQVRRAQRTYRLKKDAAVNDAKARVEEVEQKINRISDSFIDLYNAAVVSELDATSPTLFAHLERVRSAIVSDAADFQESLYLSNNSCNDSTPLGVFGYRFPGGDDNSADGGRACLQVEESIAAFPHPIVPRSISHSIGPTARDTYCFQESTFLRRLQRYCLEHAFHLFSDPRCDPQEIYQVFRLVPCITDKEKMYPRFERLLKGGSDDPLEIPSLPFYCIGGAGTHYPEFDEYENPIYPLNMRRPRRVLGIVPTAQPDGTSGMETEELLGICGLGGQWFDSKDVEGYLQEHGVNFRDSCLFPSVDLKTRDLDRMERSRGSSDQGVAHACDATGRNGMSTLPASRTQRLGYTLDLKRFFSNLLRGFAILGRAPGFRKTSVAAAFSASLIMDHN